MNRKKQGKGLPVQTAGPESGIGEAQTFGTLMRRMVRENKLAVISFGVIVLFALFAVFAPLLLTEALLFCKIKSNTKKVKI